MSRRHDGRALRLTLSCAIVGLVIGALGPAGALAANTTVLSDGTVLYQAAPFEANDVEVLAPSQQVGVAPTEIFVVEAPGVANFADTAAGCAQVSAQAVRCNRAGGFTKVDLRLKERADFAFIHPLEQMTATIEGEDGADVLTSNVPAVMNGGSGNDQLFADNPVSDDSLFGGADNDLIEGGGGEDRIEGDNGNDTLRGEDGDDFVEGDEGIPLLGGGDDVLEGGAGRDELQGGNNVDQLFGGPGLDTFFAGAGDDTVRSSDDPVPDNQLPESLRCGTGRDRAFLNQADVPSSCEARTIAP
jgi:Ca2+-binding RTX toxin-like protein